jgi:hypothetical protein
LLLRVLHSGWSPAWTSLKLWSSWRANVVKMQYIAALTVGFLWQLDPGDRLSQTTAIQFSSFCHEAKAM